MKIKEIKKLEKELEASGKRMAEYRESGAYEQEAAEHAYYNSIVEKINELLEDKEVIIEEIKEELSKLKEELKNSAERMSEYRKNGFYDREAMEHTNYNDIISLIEELEKDLEKMEKSNSKKEKEKQDKKKIEWHSELTTEQIEELEAEGIEPGDNEYRMYLLNHGIDPNNNKENDEREEETTQSNETITLDEYNRMLEIYNEDLETLYELQQSYEKREIEYTDYEKHADYMVERYRFMLDAYKNVADLSDNKETEFQGITSEDLKQKLAELNAELADEWNFRAHQENGMEQHQDDKLKEIQDEIDKIKAELTERENNPLRELTDQDLEAKKRELYAKIVDPNEYHFRAHQENGMEGYEEDEIDKGLKEIQKEIERRAKIKEEKPEKPEQPMMIEKDKEQDPPVECLEEVPRTFERIIDEIGAAENRLSFGAVERYEASKGKWLVPVQYDKGDWLRNAARFLIQGVLGNVINVPRKLYSKIMTRRDKREKMENIINNVEGLNERDFAILVEGLKSREGHTENVAAPVWKAVQKRLSREVTEKNNNRDIDIHESMQNIRSNYDRANQIKEELKKEGLSELETKQLMEEKARLDQKSAELVRKVEDLRKKGDEDIVRTTWIRGRI